VSVYSSNGKAFSLRGEAGETLILGNLALENADPGNGGGMEDDLGGGLLLLRGEAALGGRRRPANYTLKETQCRGLLGGPEIYICSEAKRKFTAQKRPREVSI